MKRLYVETFVCKKEKKLLTIETKLCIIEWQTDETAVCKYFLEKYSRGRRGAPAKGVGRVTGARVQIPPSPPQKGTPFWGCLFVIWEDLSPSDGGAGEPSKSFR